MTVVDDVDDDLVEANVAPAEALTAIHARLCASGYAVARRPDGLTAQGWRLTQHVDAAPPIETPIGAAVRITSWIPVLKVVRADAIRVELALTHFNASADSNCYVYSAAARQVDSFQVALVRHGTREFWPAVIAEGLAGQIHCAEEDAERMASLLEGDVVHAESPLDGVGETPTKVQVGAAPALDPRDAAANPFANRFEFDAIAEYANGRNAFSGGASETGVAIDAPFGRTTALVLLRAIQRHPRCKQGLAVSLKLPIFGTAAELAHIAAWLNHKEVAGELLTQGMGAWSVQRQGDSHVVVHSAFVPSAAHSAGLTLFLAQTTLWKLTLVNRILNEGVPEPNVLELMRHRLGLDRIALTVRRKPRQPDSERTLQ